MTFDVRALDLRTLSPELVNKCRRRVTEYEVVPPSWASKGLAQARRNSLLHS